MDIYLHEHASRWVCLLLIFAATAVHSKNSYLFTTPKIVRPGRVFSIEGGLLEAPPTAVTLTARLQDGATEIASAEVVTSGTESISLDLSVPAGLAKSSSLRVIIEGRGGLSFTAVNTVQFEEKSVSAYIQTDKAVYKPGQLVHFRVFGVTPELQIIFDKLQVELYDPKGNKIKIWHVSGAEMTQHGGVYVQQQQLSEFPVLGAWKLKAKLLSYMTTFEEQVFKVEEYVLPKFEVELDLPAYGKTKATQFDGKVSAMYTFGKPVKGEVSLRIKPGSGVSGGTAAEVELQFPIEGKASFTIPMSQLSTLASGGLDQKTLQFEANVTETLTRARQSDQQGVTFYTVPHKVMFPKSLPNTFKPGITYRAMVKVVQRDDTPLDSVSGRLKVTVTEYTWTTSRSDPWRQRRRFWRPRPRRREESKVRPTTQYSIPADGIVALSIKPGSKPHKLVVKAEYDGASSTLTLKKRHSPSDSFLQLTQVSGTPRAGESTAFQIRRTSATNSVNYQVFSKGKLVDSGEVALTGQLTTWNLMMTSAMAPKSRVIIFYVRPDGEVVADALNINVEGVFDNKVSVAFNTSSARPADGVSLDVRADAGSRVHLLGVDKSVLLMGTGNDVTKAEVIEELQSFDTKASRSRDRPSFRCDWFCHFWPVSVGGEDVKDVFEDSGVLVFTDANVYEHREIVEPPWEPMPRPWFRMRNFRRGGLGGRPMIAMASAGAGPVMRKTGIDRMAMSAPMSPMFDQMQAVNEKGLATPKEELAPVTRTRRLFPETWLWVDTEIPSTGIATVTEKVPDTITSWIATAFAIHPNTGLGITENSANLQVSLPFFVSVRLPYSVVRGEKVVVQVNIHNYSPQHLYVHIEMANSVEFDHIQMTHTPPDPASPEVRTITVASESIGSVYFPIIPRKLGQVDINIKAQTSLMSDAINKKLLVEPEGVERDYNLPVIIDLKDRGTFSSSVDVEFPPGTVPGSERVKASVIGDIMGPSIVGLDKLLKMPYGCGEQNMLKFAPNIFVVKYLDTTNNLDEKVRKQAINFMETGYQRELTYRHDDGSYSAFGDRDPSGSTWLTAFVLKSFVQAKPHVFIDDDVILRAVDFLVKQQNADGTFKEPGRVIHKAMQGGSTGGKLSLTAYVLISLLEAKSVDGVLAKISGVQEKALAYLEGQVGGLTDVYDLAIVTYCLTLAGSPQANTAWQSLNAKAITKDGKTHWERATKPGGASKPWRKQSGQSVDIELTSYALLALATSANRLDGARVLKWLTEHRNQDGGFASTQDTVLALQGLSEMAALIYSPTYDLTVGFSGNGLAETFQINNLNALVLQTREVPSTVGTVTVTANGQGLALAQLEVNYNVASDDQKESFRLTTVLPRESVNDFDIKVCTSWLEGGSSSMALLEIGTPSGFHPDTGSLVSEPQHKRVEVEARKMVLYFDEIGTKDTCVYITMQRIALVAGSQPVAVRVMDYYDPGKSVTDFYIPASLRDSQICDICPECASCGIVPPNVV